MDDNLPAISDGNFTSELLAKIRKLATAGTAGLTGILASDRKDMILTGGRLFQGLINHEFMDNLIREWDKYRQKAQIKDDYQQTEQHHACLQQMLDFLDNDKPDKIRFDFMKKIFLTASTEQLVDRESVLPQQYMFIARQLTSGDILLLKGIFEMHKQNVILPNMTDGQEWLRQTANHCTLNHVKLVEFHERHLIELGILTARILPRPGNPEVSTIRPAATNRLTDLGLALCEFIKGYDEK